MRVLHTNAGEVWSGIEQRIFFIARYLKKKGVWCALALSPNSPLRIRAEEEGIKVFPVKMRGKWGLSGVRILRDILQRERITLLHTHRSTDHWMSYLASRKTGVILIRTRHNYTPISPNPLNHLLYHRATHHLIAVADIIGKYLTGVYKIPPHRVTVIPSAVDVERFLSNREDLREELGISPEIPVIGMVGRLRKHKDYPTFIRFASLLLEEVPRAKFLISGDGPLENELKKMVRRRKLEDRIIFLGKRMDVEKVLRTLDVFVLTSVLEGSPAVIKEAILSEVPVVATRVGGINEIIRDGEGGFLVNPGSPEEIKNCVLHILNNPSVVKEGVRKAGERIREVYSPDRLGEKTLSLYENLHNS